MRRAIISDIHANRDAFISVLRDIDNRGIQDIVCLGDIVGYGPEPAECIALVQERCRLSLMGNHDYALLTGPRGFNRVAAQAIECNRSMLSGSSLNHKSSSAYLEFLKCLFLVHLCATFVALPGFKYDWFSGCFGLHSLGPSVGVLFDDVKCVVMDGDDDLGFDQLDGP